MKYNMLCELNNVQWEVIAYFLAVTCVSENSVLKGIRFTVWPIRID
jgi:hypothetical protein